jgi:hypothetical protein
MTLNFDGWKEAVGNRKASQGLAPLILRALADLAPRAPGPRRVTYRLLDSYSAEPVVAAMIARGKALEPPNPKTVLDENVTGTIATMREIGLLHPDRIHDGRSTVTEPLTFDNADDYIAYLQRMVEHEYRHLRQEGQKQVIEVWTEAADTLPDLREVADERGMVLVSCSGSLTVDARSELGMRIWQRSRAGIVTIILYLGDYDPPGLAIPERLEDALEWAVRWKWYIYTRNQDPRWASNDPLVERACEDDAWVAACEYARLAGVGGMTPFLQVERLGVERADLSGWTDAVGTLHTVTTSPVKLDLVQVVRYPTGHAKAGEIKPGSGAYARFWPKGESRTLQLEALDVDEVVRRVQDRVDALTNKTAYKRTLTTEKAQRSEVERRLRSA